MSGQPYSDKALTSVKRSLMEVPRHAPSDQVDRLMLERWATNALDAAHDREALGLDASVCARTFLAEIVAKLREWGNADEGVSDQESWNWTPPEVYLLREFGDQQ
jgi:hypothetical protein